MARFLGSVVGCAEEIVVVVGKMVFGGSEFVGVDF